MISLLSPTCGKSLSQHFRSMQKPLSEKTEGKGTRQMVWRDDMDEEFVELRRKLLDDLLLGFPAYDEEASHLKLFVDSSGVGSGVCLAQKQGDDTNIIAYASFTFT